MYEFDDADQPSGLQHNHAALAGAANVGIDDYLDSDAGVEAIAAAEMVARIRGLVVDRSPYNETALDRATRTTPIANQALVNLAVSALERVVATNSEIADLWEVVSHKISLIGILKVVDPAQG